MTDQSPHKGHMRAASLPREAAPLGRVQSAAKPRARHWFPNIYKRKVLLVVGDLVVVNMMLFISLVARNLLVSSWEAIEKRSYWFATLSLLWLFIGHIFDIFKLPACLDLRHSLKFTLITAAIVGFLSFVIPVLMPVLPSHRSEAIIFLLLLVGGSSLWRLIFARCFTHPVLARRALVIGAGWAGATIAETLWRQMNTNSNPYTSERHDMIGFIDDDVMKQGKVIAGLPVLGTHEDLVNLVKKLQPHELILAITDRDKLHPKMFQAILECRELGVSMVRMQTIYEKLTHQVPLEHTGNNLDVVIPLVPSHDRSNYVIFREAADILTAIPGMVFLGLAIPIVWAANCLTSPGPLMYSQERIGKAGKVFRVLKFRSMVVDAEARTGAVWAKEKDDRITPIGHLLRKSRLDELPQFWNVLKGEMSLIGPRPERQHFVEILERKIPFYRLRHAIKPGITGWAQVNYRYGASASDTLVKLRYDFYYIKHQSAILDLVILLKTIRLVLGLKGR